MIVSFTRALPNSPEWFRASNCFFFFRVLGGQSNLSTSANLFAKNCHILPKTKYIHNNNNHGIKLNKCDFRSMSHSEQSNCSRSNHEKEHVELVHFSIKFELLSAKQMNKIILSFVCVFFFCYFIIFCPGCPPRPPSPPPLPSSLLFFLFRVNYNL